MSRSIVKLLPIKPPKELVSLLEDIPLVGNEKADDYYDFFNAIANAAKPTDSIDWIYLKSVVDLTWEIRREQAIKAGIIKLMQKEVVLDLLKGTVEDSTSLKSNVYRIFHAADEANQWAVDPQVQKKIDSRLTEKGFPTQEVLVRAYIRGQNQIDAVDKRIASYEARKMAILRELERRTDKFARQLDQASSEAIDAEFSEAAE